jgi:hypothetical protein
MLHFEDRDGTIIFRKFMRKTWVLDTETKGTGAQMVPLEKVLKKPAPKPRRPAARAKPKPAAPGAVEPKQPPEFKVVDAMTRQVLAEGASTRATVDLLREVRSQVDVSIYAWERMTETWRPLTPREKKLLWGFRERERPARG